MTETSASRDFTAEAIIHAPVHQVWALLADPQTMPKASPELFALTRRGKGPYRAGEQFLGWNRRGVIVWPTRSKVTTVEPERTLAWHTTTSGAVWTYTLSEHADGTVLREHRSMPNGAPLTTRLFAGAFLGGIEGHADELESHVSQTLAWIKAELEE